MRAREFTTEAKIGTEPKRPARTGSRPERGHTPQPRYKTDQGISKDKETKFHAELDKLVHNTFGKRDDEMEEGTTKVDWNKRAKELFAQGMDEQQVKAQLLKDGCPIKQVDVYVQAGQINETGKASRSLCLSSKPDEDLGASNLASCKSQGLRARDGNKSHKLGKSPKSRIKVGGHKIKGKKYGGKLPDWS